MAQALSEVRSNGAYSKWGYESFHDYCADELKITKATADKLTGSYAALKTHAPAVLKRDGIKEPLPTVGAVDYFAKALRGSPANDSEDYPDEVVEELRHAVFEDGAPVSELRKRFNPVFHPKSPVDEQLDAIKRTRQTAHRLLGQLDEINGLNTAAAREVRDALDRLLEDLGTLASVTRSARTG